MAGSLLIAWLAGSALACEDLPQNVAWAQEEVLEVNEDAARQLLGTAEKGIGCGSPQSPEDLARFFLVDGATAAMEADTPAMQDAFAAAARISADTWIEALGPKMRSEYEAAAALPVSTGTIEVASEGWETRLNGKLSTFPAKVPAGLHVVEIVDDDRVAFGRIVWVLAGEVQVLEPGLPERKTEPAGPVVVEAPVKSPSDDPVARLSVGLGAAAAFGQGLSGVTSDGDPVDEPGMKLTFPLEIGAVIQAETLWIRPAIGLAPLVGGRFLFATEDGAGTSGFAVLADLSAGVGAGDVDVGGLIGIRYPGRIALRGLGGLPLGDTPLFAELRAGVNVATGGRVEPAFGLGLSARVP